MKYVTIVLAVFAFIYALDTISAIAAEFEEHGQDILSGNTEPEPVYHSMIATAYCLTGSTATGTTPRAGIAASKREWFGKTVRVYKNQDGNIGELIGTYVIEDTGGKTIQNGSVIDIWLPTEEECKQFGRKTVYVVVE